MGAAWTASQWWVEMTEEKSFERPGLRAGCDHGAGRESGWSRILVADRGKLKETNEGEGEISQFSYTGPEGKPGGESRFPLSLKTDGVFNTKLFKKKKTKGNDWDPGDARITIPKKDI